MLTICVAAALMLQGPGGVPQTYTGPKKRAAVSGFSLAITGLSVTAQAPSGALIDATIDIVDATSFGTGMEDMLTTALIASKRFVVLERKDLEDIKKEQAVLKGGGDDPATGGSEPKFDPSRLLGAQILVRGSLTEMAYKKSGGGFGGGILDINRLELSATVAIDLKLIDAETGEVLDSIRSEGKVGSNYTAAKVLGDQASFGYESFETSPLAKAVRQAIDKGVALLVARTEKIPWESRVASVGGTQEARLLYLSFGSDAGVAVGTELEVFRPGAPVIDPDTKVVIGREDDVAVGKCRVRSSTSKLSVATVTEGLDFKPGDGVRLAKS